MVFPESDKNQIQQTIDKVLDHFGNIFQHIPEQLRKDGEPGHIVSHKIVRDLAKLANNMGRTSEDTNPTALEIYQKIEEVNPGGSHRVVLAVIEYISHQMTIVEIDEESSGDSTEASTNNHQA